VRVVGRETLPIFRGKKGIKIIADANEFHGGEGENCRRKGRRDKERTQPGWAKRILVGKTERCVLSGSVRGIRKRKGERGDWKAKLVEE